MPEIQRADPTQYTLRHIRLGDSAKGTGFAPALQYPGRVTVLGKSTSFEELPISELINSPDLVNGTWTARLQDAGTWTMAFPNRTASDGIPWLTRFEERGFNDWIEIRRGGYLEFVAAVGSVKADYQSVAAAGWDAAYCLKKVYERDWQTVQAPRDVCYHATCLPVPQLVEAFTESVLPSSWTPTVVGTGSIAIGSTGLVLSCPASNDSATVETVANLPFTQRWSLSLTFTQTLTTGAQLQIVGPNASWTLYINGPAAAPTTVFGTTVTGQGPALNALTGTNSVIVEFDGKWVRAYVNGQLVGYQGYAGGNTIAVSQLSIGLANNNSATNSKATISNVVMEAYEPFLMAGTDQGDYVLPGTASTYPTGGLHARYYNDLSQSALGGTAYLQATLNPSKDNPASGQPSPYDVVETTINANSPASHVTTGFATTNWSAKFFGAVYLPLATGDIGMAIDTAGAGQAIRVWVGQTLFGAQLVDQWAISGGSVAYSFTVTQAALANGQGQVLSGWYPIVIEVANTTATAGPTLYFANLPAGYTDPGGTVIAAGAQNTVVPSTSLSPLGCVDQRFQGVSYFDMYQQTANAFGYQFVCEPQQLESSVTTVTPAPAQGGTGGGGGANLPNISSSYLAGIGVTVGSFIGDFHDVTSHFWDRGAGGTPMFGSVNGTGSSLTANGFLDGSGVTHIRTTSTDSIWTCTIPNGMSGNGRGGGAAIGFLLPSRCIVEWQIAFPNNAGDTTHGFCWNGPYTQTRQAASTITNGYAEIDALEQEGWSGGDRAASMTYHWGVGSTNNANPNVFEPSPLFPYADGNYHYIHLIKLGGGTSGTAYTLWDGVQQTHFTLQESASLDHCLHLTGGYTATSQPSSFPYDMLIRAINVWNC